MTDEKKRAPGNCSPTGAQMDRDWIIDLCLGLRHDCPDCVKQMPLTKGLFALVDTDRFDELSKFLWSASIIRSSHVPYIQVVSRIDGEGVNTRLTDLIHKAAEGHVVDHVNGIPLDNRRINLREITDYQNSLNKLSQSWKSNTGFRGVFMARKRYQGIVVLNGKRNYTTSCKTAHEAAILRDNLCASLHGEFGVFNFERPEFPSARFIGERFISYTDLADAAKRAGPRRNAKGLPTGVQIRCGRYHVALRIKGKMRWVGTFGDLVEAEKAKNTVLIEAGEMNRISNVSGGAR